MARMQANHYEEEARYEALNVQRAIQKSACPLKHQQRYLEAEWMTSACNTFASQVKRYPFDKDVKTAWDGLTGPQFYFAGAPEGWVRRSEYVKAKLAIFEHGEQESALFQQGSLAQQAYQGSALAAAAAQQAQLQPNDYIFRALGKSQPQAGDQFQGRIAKLAGSLSPKQAENVDLAMQAYIKKYGMAPDHLR